jgi:hypothetical protein
MNHEDPDNYSHAIDNYAHRDGVTDEDIHSFKKNMRI